MSILRLPGLVQTKQPYGQVTLDLSNPFARNTKLILASVVGKYLMQTLVGCTPSNGQSFGEAGHSKVITPQGVFTATAGGGYGDNTSTDDFVIDKIGTIIFSSFFKIGSASTSLAASRGNAGANDGTVALNSNSTLTVTANADYTFTSAALADGFHTVVFSNMRTAGKQAVWIDGVLVDSSGTSTGQQGFTSNSIGCGTVSSGSNVAIGMVGVMLGGPSTADDFAKFFAVYPWGLLSRSPQLVMLVAAGGGTSYSYTASGGFTLSGTAAVVRGAVKTATGGVTLSGAATQSRGAVRSAAGGIQLSGTASIAKGRAITASGGLAISGAATILRGVARSAAGGLQLAGAAGVTFFSAVQSRVVNPVGGIIFGGTAAVVRTCTRLVSGGITFGGTSPVEFFSILSTGASNWIGYIRRRGRR